MSGRKETGFMPKYTRNTGKEWTKDKRKTASRGLAQKVVWKETS
jgi:hypothetical protein